MSWYARPRRLLPRHAAPRPLQRASHAARSAAVCLNWQPAETIGRDVSAGPVRDANRQRRRRPAFQNWRGKPLVIHHVIGQRISAIAPATRLNVACRIDTNPYLKGITVSDAAMAAINLTRDDFHGAWNDTIAPGSHPERRREVRRADGVPGPYPATYSQRNPSSHRFTCPRDGDGKWAKQHSVLVSQYVSRNLRRVAMPCCAL